jgi:acetyltransferase-like isoleucine patch superfamily enzyme
MGPDAHLVGTEKVSVGARLAVMGGLSIWVAGEGSLEIGDDCSFNGNVQLYAGPQGAVRLGNAVLLGPNVVLRNCDHNWRDPDRRIRDQGHSCDDIVLEDDVWVAANAVVLGGAILRRGTVVAAGAVVRAGEYGPGALLTGVPATAREGRVSGP